MYFGRALPFILQEIWEAEPVHGPVYLSKLNAIETFYWGTLWTYQVSNIFSHITLSVANYGGIIICIDLLPPIGWVESINYFHYLYKMITNVAT